MCDSIPFSDEMNLYKKIQQTRPLWENQMIQYAYNPNPQINEQKERYPETYYQPFSSSFDPTYGSVLKTRQTSSQNRLERSSEHQISFDPFFEELVKNLSAQPSYDLPPFPFDEAGTLGDTVTEVFRSPPYPANSKTRSRSSNSEDIFSNIGYFNENTTSSPTSFSDFPDQSEENVSPSSSFGTQHSVDSDINSFRRRRKSTNSFRDDQSFTGVETSSSVGSNPDIKLGNKFSKKKNKKDVSKKGFKKPMICNFCKNNREVPAIYEGHHLYDPETNILSCPVLRKHVCEVCGNTGDFAHTLQYCPINQSKGSSVAVLIKTRTVTNSTGKIRKY